MKKIKGRNGGTLHIPPKGVSANPNGRPPKLPDLEQLMAKVLGEEKDGRTAAEVILMALRAKAARGDVRAGQILMERGYGKPKENEGKPTQMVITVKRNT